MKSSIFLNSVLATSALAWPKPQLLDLNLGARVTVFATVTVTQPALTCRPVSTTVTVRQPASTCLPTSTTRAAVGQSSLRTSTSRSVAPPQTTLKPASVSSTSWTPVPRTTSKPVTPVSSSRPQSTSSTTPAPKPTTQAPSNGGRVTGTAQAYLSVGASYQAAILYHHNAARANHGALPLTWDSSCENNARLAANTCNYAPYLPTGVVQGQNLYISAGDAFNVTAAITEVWYKNEFSSAVPWFGVAGLPVTIVPTIGHLTQVLWKGTTKVGCASVNCGTKMKVNGATSSSNKYTVCNYASAGNIAGQFAINVGRPLSSTNLGKWTD